MSFLGLVVSPDKPLGEYVKIYLARSRDPQVLEKKPGSGGAVTSILLYMLEERLVDAVVVARKTKGLQGEVVVARRKEEILEAAGSRWSIVPFTLKLKEILLSSNVRRAALVGLPCQAQYLFQVKNYPLLETDFSEKIGFIISLFCMGTFATEAFLSYIARSKGIAPETIENVRFEEGKIVVVHEKGVLRLPIGEIIQYMQLGCLICPDYTGVFADISAGVSKYKPGYTVLIARNEESKKIIEDASKKGYLELVEADEKVVERLESEARDKIARATKYMATIL